MIFILTKRQERQRKCLSCFTNYFFSKNKMEYNDIDNKKIEPDFHIKLYLLILNLATFYFVCTFQIFTVVEISACPKTSCIVL